MPDKRPRCPQCRSYQIAARRREPRFHCRRCNWRGDNPIWEKIEPKSKEQGDV